MAISKQRKEELVAQYVDLFQHSQGFILTDYRGLSTPQMEGLRRAVRAAEGSFVVTKNTLVARALEQLGLPVLEEWLTSHTAIGFCHRQIPAVAKALVEAGKETGLLRIKGALLGESVLGAAEVQVIADLPPREVLLARVAGGLQAPISGLVNVLAGTIRGLLNVLNARVEQLGGAEA